MMTPKQNSQITAISRNSTTSQQSQQGFIYGSSLLTPQHSIQIYSSPQSQRSPQRHFSPNQSLNQLITPTPRVVVKRKITNEYPSKNINGYNPQLIKSQSTNLINPFFINHNTRPADFSSIYQNTHQNELTGSEVSAFSARQVLKQPSEIEIKIKQAVDKSKKLVESLYNRAELKNQIQMNRKKSDKQVKFTESEQTKEAQEKADQLEDLVLNYSDGYIYRGQVKLPDTRQGFGILRDQDGIEVYVGFWQNNNFHGKGRLKNPKYLTLKIPHDWNDMSFLGNLWNFHILGEFVNGIMHGHGLLLLTNGEKYEGQFNQGKIHGLGKFTKMSGDIVEGIWNEGLYIKGD